MGMGSASLRALVVDDNADHSLLMAEALRRDLGAEAFRCDSVADALARLADHEVDAVVLDYRLPDARRWEAIALIHSRVDAPIVVVTGQGSEQAAVQALKAGAADYVPKEGDYLRRLPSAVVHAVEIHQRRRQELAHLKAASDALAQALDMDSVVEAAAGGAIALLRADGAWLLLPNEEGTLELIGARGTARQDGQGKPQSRACAPVALKGAQQAGFLCARASAPARFGPHELELLRTLASHTASALQNARLFASLERAKVQWERTFDSISDPIVISDRERRVVRLNKAAARYLDIPLREAIGRRSCELLLGEQEPCPWHEGVLHGTPVSSDRYLPHRGRWVSFSAFPFEDADQQVVGIVHVLRDVTEERMLRRGVAQAQKLAAIGELVAGVAHELNNPLTGILGFAHLLLRRAPEPAIAEDLQKIAGEARRAARIVRNLSAFARLPAAPALRRHRVDVNDLIRKTVELRHYQLHTAGITVELELDEDLPHTLADPDELQQVFLNIMNNAEQAMVGGERPGRLTIHTQPLEPEQLRIAFRDTGPGIPPEALDHIFDPFFTTKEAARGTGLGLSVCYGIVRGHGGRIAAANRPEGGAVFTIHLPVREQADVQPKADSTGEAAPAAPARILVVDDEPIVGDFVERALAELGHRVVVAQTGEAAVGGIRDGAWDLVVCDLKLPDMGGAEIYRAALECAPALRDRFVFLTGDTLGPETAAFLRTDPGPWLEKPLTPDQLKRVVNDRLLGASANDA